MDEKNLINHHDQLVHPPTDYFEMEDWNGGEIYRGESYLELSNGDFVLNKKENVLEYLSEHYEYLTDLLDPIFRTAGKE